MAVLTLTPSTPYTIKYTISNMTEEWVDTARVELFYYGQEQAIKTTTYAAIDVARTTTIFGYFTGLKPHTRYTVHENIFDKDGIQSSSQTESTTTLEEYKDTDNSVIHSINFATSDDVFNTYENWGLVPATRPSIKPPELKSKYVDLPASDGVLDYTELLLGKVPFGRRTGSWTFYTDEKKMTHLGYTWNTLYAELLEKINGLKVEITLDDDLDFFYKGRVSVNQWRSSKAFSAVTFDYNCDSYKYSRTSSDDVDWQWDVCLEEPDYTILYGNYSTQEYKVLNFVNPGGQETTPDWESSDVVTIKVNFGTLVQDVILGKYGAGEARKQALTEAGLCWQIVQNAVNEALNSPTRIPVPYDDPDPDVQARIAATEALKNQGQLDTGEEYTLQKGTNNNNNLSLKPGDNVILNTSGSNADIHAQYKETSL